MNKDPHLQIALQKGQWVSILAVPSGLACGCICPACGGRLMAKKGVKQQHHFAHHREAKCFEIIKRVFLGLRFFR